MFRAKWQQPRLAVVPSYSKQLKEYINRTYRGMLWSVIRSSAHHQIRKWVAICPLLPPFLVYPAHGQNPLVIWVKNEADISAAIRMLHIIREERIIKKIFIAISCYKSWNSSSLLHLILLNFLLFAGGATTGLSSSLGGGVADASSAAAALAVPGPLALGGVSANGWANSSSSCTMLEAPAHVIDKTTTGADPGFEKGGVQFSSETWHWWRH